MSDKELEEHQEKIEKQKKEERKKIEEEKKATKKTQEKERKKAKEKHQEEIDREKMRIKKKPYKMSLWLRLVNIVIGISFIAASSFIILNQELVVDTIVLILAGLVVISGVIRFFNAFYDKQIGGTKRLVRFLFALILIGLGVAIYLIEGLGEDVLLLFLEVALIIQGFSRIFVGLTHDVFQLWMKLILVILGIGLIAIAVLAYLSDIGEIQNITTLLAYGFILGGVGRIAFAFAGLTQTPANK